MSDAPLRLSDSRTEILFRPASPYEFPSVVRLYEEGGYTGRYQAADFMLLGMAGQDAVAVLRLVEEQHHQLLRGLYVAKEWRGQGIARRLVQAALERLHEPCYCLTHTELLNFFASAGFLPCSDEEAPAFLLERRRQYGWTGKTYHILLRIPPAG
jgi:GNAT superfamily N-acetyltransferase